jgi:hypothetical protein
MAASLEYIAVAYRPVIRNEVAQIDVWVSENALGEPLPLMPLRLGDLFVPVDFGATSQEARRRRQLA